MRSINSGSVVAVVGGAGFLGSHLVDYLIEKRRCSVIVIDNLVTGKLEFVNEDAEFIHHDITADGDRLEQIFKEKQVDYVFNYAACPYIPISFKLPTYVLAVNFGGAVKVIEAAAKVGVKGILQVSSAEIYGGGYTKELSEYPPSIDENAPVEPHSTYGVAKAAVDNYCRVSYIERKTPVISLRQFNCLGERETHPYIIPEIISQVHKEAMKCEKSGIAIADAIATIKLGNNSYRDFLYAGDAVKIAVELLEMGQFGEVYNLGSGDSFKMYELAEMIAKIYGFYSSRVEYDAKRARPWEIWALRADCDKLNKLVSFSGLRSLDKALRKTLNWFQFNDYEWPWER